MIQFLLEVYYIAGMTDPFMVWRPVSPPPYGVGLIEPEIGTTVVEK